MLNSTLDSEVIKKFFHWWSQELAFFIPESVRQFFKTATNSIVIQLKPTQLHLRYTINHSQKFISFERNEKGLNDYYQFKLAHPGLEKAIIILRMNHHEGVMKELVLPKATAENLAQVMRYELNRYTPFTPEQVYYSVNKIATTTTHLTLQLILVPQHLLDDAYEFLKSWNLTPRRVDYEGMIDTKYAAPYNLLPEAKRQQPNKKVFIAQSLLVSVFILLLSSAMILPLWFYTQSVKSLNKDIKRIKKKAIAVQDIQNKIAVLTEKTDWLIEQKKQTRPLVNILNTISQLLNDDTSLTIIEYKNKKLHLTGQSPAAATLINVLETSPLFSEADFESTVTKNKTTGLERFRIVVKVNASENDGSD